jgi:hypothetical protein
MQKPQKTLDVVPFDVVCFDEEVLLDAKPPCEASHHFLGDRLVVLHKLPAALLEAGEGIIRDP